LSIPSLHEYPISTPLTRYPSIKCLIMSWTGYYSSPAPPTIPVH